MRYTIKKLLQTGTVGTTVEIGGWIRTKRTSKQVVFLAMNDGSCQGNLQIVVDPTYFSASLLDQLHTGASIVVIGELLSSKGAQQSIELQAKQLTLLGNAANYPLQPKTHSLEFLRSLAHLRFRTNTFGAIFRIRAAISYAIHHFFHTRGFCYIHTPIITAADAEGAGELFQVTSLDMNNLQRDNLGNVNFTEDFFKKKSYLTVSGQLAAEAAMMGLGAVYTFGPTFRAENSNTTRHLAEFWMIEAEAAFYDLKDTIALAEELLRFLINYTLCHCKEELYWLQRRTVINKQERAGNNRAMPLVEQLTALLEEPFVQITHREAIAILKEASSHKRSNFIYPIHHWDDDLQSEHERYLTEHYFKSPVIVTDYPKTTKAFYMRQHDDGQTVAAMDILFPYVGEVVGGSQREERIDCLQQAMQPLSIADLDWYLDTRRFGSVPHSGFGLGLERFLLFITAMENIRDVIPFPRTPGQVMS